MAFTIFSDIMKNMLVKNSKIFCDAHIHFTLVPDFIDESQSFDFLWKGCSCCHSKKEWETQINLQLPQNITLLNAFGLHPQSAGFIDTKEQADFLESILIKNDDSKSVIKAIGEAGFDFFTEDFRNQSEKQEEIFNIQLELAKQYKLPLIIHSRKSTEKLFEYSKELKKLPAVLFHSFMGNSIQAKALLNKEINGYFSFGKQLKNNNKKAIDCALNLPLENLLLETDAPYQFLKDEKYTEIGEIEKVYEYLKVLRKEKCNSVILETQMEQNFNFLFNLK